MFKNFFYKIENKKVSFKKIRMFMLLNTKLNCCYLCCKYFINEIFYKKDNLDLKEIIKSFI